MNKFLESVDFLNKTKIIKYVYTFLCRARAKPRREAKEEMMRVNILVLVYKRLSHIYDHV